MIEPLITCQDIEAYTDLAGGRPHCWYCGDNTLDDCRCWGNRNEYDVMVETCCEFSDLADAITPEIAEDIYRKRGYR